MRIFALELDNDIKGIARRDAYVEDLIRRLPQPELVVLPELSRSSYMASQAMWQYADDCGRETSEWAVRAANALGRIGRADFSLIEPYWTGLFRFASDEHAKVRLSFIWASENIAVNTPDIYQDSMPVFEKLLHDPDDRVRMEAPEIFRVLGKRRPEIVRPLLEELLQLSETDENRVVRIHCLGAIKATGKQLLL